MGICMNWEESIAMEGLEQATTSMEMDFVLYFHTIRASCPKPLSSRIHPREIPRSI